MKQFWRIIARYYPWLLLLLGVDCFCFIIFWISDIQAFQTLIGLVVLTSILLFSAILFVLNKRETTRRELFRDFLSDPTICNEERLLSAISREEGESIRLLASVLQEHKTESNSMADALQDYEEYVEGWAHEAKTPLSLLTMLLDNRSNEMSPPLQAKLDYVRSQLQEDVTQMLYYARLKSSTKDYQFKDINLNDCLGEVLEDYAPLLEEKQFVILNKLQSETVYTDRRGLQFMLGQIVSNSIKYTPVGGSVMVDVDELSCDESGYMIERIRVSDTGIGMSQDYLKKIFEAFTREQNTTKSKIVGTGLGMSIVKKYVDLLGGTINVESEFGKGSTFTVTLKHRIADESYYVKKYMEEPGTGSEILEGRNILLAEDNDLNAEIVEAILESVGLKIERVEDGIQCVNRIEKMPADTYDMILMDIQMPKMDGYKATQAIRNLTDKDKASIPIIAMTANAFEEDKRDAIAAGMNGHIAKPIQVDKMLSILSEVIRQRENY